jgi:hypothetical protein
MKESHYCSVCYKKTMLIKARNRVVLDGSVELGSSYDL